MARLLLALRIHEQRKVFALRKFVLQEVIQKISRKKIKAMFQTGIMYGAPGAPILYNRLVKILGKKL